MLPLIRRVLQVVAKTGGGVDAGDLAAELVGGVVAVAGALLAVACDTVADDLMGHAAVARYFYGDGTVLHDRFVAAFDDACDEFLCSAFSNALLALVADSSDFLDPAQHVLVGFRAQDFNFRLYCNHVFSSFYNYYGIDPIGNTSRSVSRV